VEKLVFCFVSCRIKIWMFVFFSKSLNLMDNIRTGSFIFGYSVALVYNNEGYDMMNRGNVWAWNFVAIYFLIYYIFFQDFIYFFPFCQKLVCYNVLSVDFCVYMQSCSNKWKQLAFCTLKTKHLS